MFFLLRMAFWLCVVCVLLSSGGRSTSPDAQIDASEAVTLASAAVSDMRGFCERQPDACVTGGKVAVALGHKAEAGARTLYEFVTKLREKSASTKTLQARIGRHVDPDRYGARLACPGAAATAPGSARRPPGGLIAVGFCEHSPLNPVAACARRDDDILALYPRILPPFVTRPARAYICAS